MVDYVKSLGFILILSCLIGVAYAGTAGEESGEGALIESPFILEDENSVADATEVWNRVDDTSLLTEELESLIQQNSLSRIAVGSAEVQAGGTVTVPISVANLTAAEGIGFWIFFDPAYLEVTNVLARAGVTTNTSLNYNVTQFHPGEVFLRVAMTHDALNVGTTPVAVADITFKSKTGVAGETELFFGNAEWSHDFLNVPFAFMDGGVITLLPPELPDLTGYLDPAPPDFIKKYKNGTIFMDPTFVIRNIGRAGVNQEFDVRVTFVGESANYTIRTPIGVNSNFTIYTDITIDPTYSGTNVVEAPDTGSVTLYITAGGDIAPGQKQIAININPEHVVEEIRYDNNFIETQTTLTYPDLLPVLETVLVEGLASSNTTINDNMIPGTHKVTYGVKNDGDVYAVPTYLRVARDGVNTFYSIPALQPGENWTQSETITLDKTKSAKTYTVEVNSQGPQQQEATERIHHPDQGQQSKTITSQ